MNITASKFGVASPGLRCCCFGVAMELMNMENPFDKKGFTLIELIFAVIIVGVLASLAIPRFSDTIENPGPRKPSISWKR